MFSLLYQFGYDQDDYINQRVMDEVTRMDNSSSNLCDLFARKYAPDNLQVRHHLMKWIYDNTDSDNTIYMDILEKCGYFIQESLLNDNPDPFTREERFKILTYILYYSGKGYVEKGTRPWGYAMRTICDMQDQKLPGMWDYLDENCYLNLPGYNELINQLLGEWEVLTAQEHTISD